MSDGDIKVVGMTELRVPVIVTDKPWHSFEDGDTEPCEVWTYHFRTRLLAIDDAGRIQPIKGRGAAIDVTEYADLTGDCPPMSDDEREFAVCEGHKSNVCHVRSHKVAVAP